MSRPKLLFLATEDWFFRSHFLFLARQAAAEGYECVVAARDSGALAHFDGVRLIDLPFARGSMRPWELGSHIAQLRAVIARERPALIHAIALKPIGLLALAQARDVPRVFAVTGRGYLATARAPLTRLIGWRLQRLLRRELIDARSVLMVENSADGDWAVGAAPLDSSRIFLMPGAGVDTDVFTVSPEPSGGPIVVGVVTRLIRSKGVDLVVEAVRRLRAEGADIVLRIAGDADEENPGRVSAEEIARWRAHEGVELVGRVTDVNGFWRHTHIACLPSRGGEGLARSLLEAAACGRPLVTSDTPGCADFVRHKETGLIVRSEDSAALADALRLLAGDGALRAALGAAARKRVVEGYTEAHAGRVAAQAWRRAMAQRAGRGAG